MVWVKMVNAGNSTCVEKCTLWALLELCVFFFLNLCHMWLQCNTCAAINSIVKFYLEYAILKLFAHWPCLGLEVRLAGGELLCYKPSCLSFANYCVIFMPTSL